MWAVGRQTGNAMEPRNRVLQTAEVRRLIDSDSIPELTRLLHRSYGPLAAMGMRFLASHQSDAVTRKRVGGGSRCSLPRVRASHHETSGHHAAGCARCDRRPIPRARMQSAAVASSYRRPHMINGSSRRCITGGQSRLRSAVTDQTPQYPDRLSRLAVLREKCGGEVLVPPRVWLASVKGE